MILYANLCHIQVTGKMLQCIKFRHSWAMQCSWVIVDFTTIFYVYFSRGHLSHGDSSEGSGSAVENLGHILHLQLELIEKVSLLLIFITIIQYVNEWIKLMCYAAVRAVSRVHRREIRQRPVSQSGDACEGSSRRNSRAVCVVYEVAGCSAEASATTICTLISSVCAFFSVCVSDCFWHNKWRWGNHGMMKVRMRKGIWASCLINIWAFCHTACICNFIGLLVVFIYWMMFIWHWQHCPIRKYHSD